MDGLVPLQAGPFRAHEVKDNGVKLVGALESDVGGRMAAFTPVPNPNPSRSAPKVVGYALEAPDGAWFLQTAGLTDRGVWPVLDGAGVPVGAIRSVSTHERTLHTAAGEVRWQQHTMRPQYRIDGLFTANRTALHSFASGVSRRPFTGELTDALIARGDASMLFLLAAWCTSRFIEMKDAAEN